MSYRVPDSKYFGANSQAFRLTVAARGIPSVNKTRRGQLQLLYRGETETIAEGESYRVILDPSDDPAKKKRAVKGTRERKTFLLIATTGAVAGAAAAAALHENHGHKKMESPDRP